MSRAFERGGDVRERIRSLPARWREWYHVPILGGIVILMLWIRLQAYENFIVNGQVYFSGNDAYYHFREVMYVVNHWPWTMPFDPWTYFPYGTEQGQFGTLFDQIIATAALVVGLGSPSEQLVARVHLVAPAVFGALVAIPVYGIGKRIDGRLTGIVAAAVLALLPGSFLVRTTVGFPDHNSAEPLFQAGAILALIVAVHVAEREKPVFEQVLDRDWSGLRPTVAWSVVAGGATFLYVMVWPPAVFLVGLLGVFFTLALSYDFVRGRSPEHVAFVGAISMAVVFVLSAVRLDTLAFSSTRVSLFHLLISLGVGAGSVFMAWLARAWERRSLPTDGYPATVLALIAAGVAATAVVLPSFFGTLFANVIRIFAFGQSDTALTVREAQSVFTNAGPDVGTFEAIGQLLLPQYGLAFLVAAAGLVWLLVDVRRDDDYSAAAIFVVVWAVATAMMALTQVRFNYYLATVVALLTAYFLVQLLGVIGIEDVDDVRDVETYQALTLLAVLVVILVPLMPGIAGPSAVQAAQANGPGSSVVWGQSLDWVQGNTPAEGRYGGANNDLAYYGTYEQTDDFPYPEGAYGVMSWWDYGHWITVMGERVPNANPFQQGPRPASAFLQASNETRANLMLEALPSVADNPNAVIDMSVAELHEVVDDQNAQHANEDTRYVMIDDQMAGGKFRAIATWAGPASGPDASFQQVYYDRREVSVFDDSAQLVGMSQRYQNTVLARLYFRDANGFSHYRLVHESDQQTTFVSVAQQTASGPRSALVHRQLTGPLFQAVQQRSDLEFYDVQRAARVKTYERVEGARLIGTVPEAQNGTPVVAYVQLQTSTERNFTYVQQTQTGPDGSFAMTVPYATDDAVGTEAGGTNSSVRALGEYTVQAGTPFSASASGSAAVPEEAIYEGREIQVDLEPVEQGNQSTAGGNQSTGDGGQQSEGGSQSPGSGNESSSPGNETVGALATERRAASVRP